MILQLFYKRLKNQFLAKKAKALQQTPLSMARALFSIKKAVSTCWRYQLEGNSNRLNKSMWNSRKNAKIWGKYVDFQDMSFNFHKIILNFTKQDLTPRPFVYKAIALPSRYRSDAIKVKLKWNYCAKAIKII